MKVLTITPWYPSKIDSMSGLFVRNFVEETAKTGINQEVFSKVRFIDILKGIIHYSKKKNRPEIVHLHVVTKQGIIALFLQEIYNIPYIITEHWSGYYSKNGSYKQLTSRPIIGCIDRLFIKRVFRKADKVTAVSQQLIERLKELGLIENGIVLHNIVPDFFVGKEDEREIQNMEFISVTCFDNKAKNLTGIIDAIKMIREKEFVFTFIGDGHDKDMVMEYAHNQGVDDKVQFVGKLEPQEVARRMRTAGCLILNSNYETACVVLQEALTVGLPIISTPVGIAPEYKEHIEFSEIGNPTMLAEAMSRFIDNPKAHHKGVTDFQRNEKQLLLMYETLLSCR